MLIMELYNTTQVTPSSHIYLGTHANQVNMRREATMIIFDLLCDLKEVELTKHHM